MFVIPYGAIEINIGEQAIRPLVQTPHPSLPRWQDSGIDSAMMTLQLWK
jgi:hypothetical protein